MQSGKKLTRAQRQIMNQNGIKDCTDWLYIKMKQTDDGAYLVVQNRITEEVKEILVPKGYY